MPPYLPQTFSPEFIAKTGGLEDLKQFLGSSTEALNMLAGQEEAETARRFGVTGRGRSGGLESNIQNIRMRSRQGLENIIRRIAEIKILDALRRKEKAEDLANLEAFQLRGESRAEERAKKSEERRREAGGKLGGLSLLGAGLGGLAGSFLGGPVGAGLGAKAGGEFARGIGGLEYGLEPSFTGLENIAGYLGGQEQRASDLKFLRELYGLSPEK